MKTIKLFYLLTIILVLFTACGENPYTPSTNSSDIKDYSNITLNSTNASDEEVTNPSTYQPKLNRTVLIGSHYVTSFTEAKVNNEIIFADMKEIYGRYNIVALQGIEDIDVVSRLAGPLDKRYTISEKVGKDFDQINFAFLYDRDISLDKDFTFKTYSMLYEPYVAIFSIGEYKFALVNFLSENIDAQENIGQIEYIVNYLKSTEDINDVYVMGNLYSDCEYYTQGVYLKDYTWLINKDTTVEDTICTYSQIIDPNPSNSVYQSSGVDTFDYLDFEYESLKKSISEEYLVWIELKI